MFVFSLIFMVTLWPGISSARKVGEIRTVYDLGLPALVQQLPMSSDVEWKGTAPFCSGDCDADEVVVASFSSSSMLYGQGPHFGASCAFGTQKSLCSSAFSFCNQEMISLQMTCELIPPTNVDAVNYRGCSWVDAANLTCSAGESYTPVLLKKEAPIGFRVISSGMDGDTPVAPWVIEEDWYMWCCE